MKTLMAMLVTTAMLAGLSAPSDAASRQKKQARYYTSAPKTVVDELNHKRQPKYDSNRVRFGSQLWWQQFERERGGGMGSDGGGSGSAGL